MKKEYLIHQEPALRDLANFIVNARIDATDFEERWEQLWATQVSTDRFKICCIPFFIYDLALGDVVQTRTEGDKHYVVDAVVVPSGHYTFRVWFGTTNDPKGRAEVINEVNRLGCFFEWYSGNLLAIDAANGELAKQVADYLAGLEQSGAAVYETGRSK